MVTIDELRSEQLKNLEVFEQIKELSDSFVLRMQIKEAYFLQEKLGSLLETSDVADFQPELYKKYQDLIAQLRWVALAMLPNEEVLKVLKESYLAVLENEDVDPLGRIEAKMFSLGLMPRNELRQEMQGALKENIERIGSRTFGEWLLDYSKTFDFRDRDELSPVKYVRQSSEAQALSESEKNKLRKALRLFDRVLLVTPVVDEFALGLLLREMIKVGTIKRENISPSLLQSFSIPIEKPEVTRILTEAAARSKIERETEEPKLREVSRKPEKPKKPGFFKRLFGKKPKKPQPEAGPPRAEKKQKGPKPEEIIPPKIEEAAQRLGKIPSIYKGKISPYEQKREVGPTHIGRIIPPSPRPPLEKRIPTFPEKTKQEIKKLEKLEKEKEEKPQKVDIKGKYRIQTMKKDIEKAKQVLRIPTDRQAKPKVKNNIVDLSGK